MVKTEEEKMTLGAHCDLDLEDIKPIFPYDTLAQLMMT